MFRILCCLYDGRLVQVAFVIYIEPAECILQAEDLFLLELRKLPVFYSSLAICPGEIVALYQPLDLYDVHDV